MRALRRFRVVPRQCSLKCLRSGASTAESVDFQPRARLNYKNSLFVKHLESLDKFKAEVAEAARERQHSIVHGRKLDGVGDVAERTTDSNSNVQESDGPSAVTADTVAEQKRVFEEIQRDPDKMKAFKASMKAYHDQFKHAVDVEIQNGRTFYDAGLAKSGFVLLPHSSAVQDWEDGSQVQRLYYSEMREMVQKLTGASRCFVNSHVIRNSGCSGKGSDFPPFFEVHSDFTENYKLAVERSLMSGEELTPTFGVIEKLRSEGVTVEEIQDSQLMVIHAWRSVGEEPLRNTPLAVCDRRSVGENDWIRETVRGLERYRALHSPSHKWYWFPDMTKDEVLLFTGFDSESKMYAFHSAFEHPGTPQDAPPRLSCELRLMCLIPKTAVTPKAFSD